MKYQVPCVCCPHRRSSFYVGGLLIVSAGSHALFLGFSFFHAFQHLKRAFYEGRTMVLDPNFELCHGQFILGGNSIETRD